MRSTPNIVANYATGTTFPAAAANDIATIVASADDDALYELTGLEPPASASTTNVNVGFIPLRSGPVVFGNAGARGVVVAPMRILRSSTDNAYPRALLSGVISTDTPVALPTVAPAGKWGLELLYAQLTYVDASNPTKGTAVTLNWAPSPTYVVFANAANAAALPANTSTSWNVPICYVKNVAGATTVALEDIVAAPPSIAGALPNLRQRIAQKFSGLRVQRGYCNAQNNPTRLLTGGASAYATGTQTLTSTRTPATVGRSSVDCEIREFLIPKEVTGGTSGVEQSFVIDDTRDWRKGNFKAEWCISNSAVYFGEDDDSTGTAASRQFPATATSGVAAYLTFGQSHEVLGGIATYYSAGSVDQPLPALNGGTAYFTNPADYVRLAVDTSTGYLKLLRSIAGTGAGNQIYIVLTAFFPNAR